MSHNEAIWIIVGIAGFFGSIGLVVGLREVVYRVNSIPVHNRLRRNQGDIELNYIEPNSQINLDLLQPPVPIYERFTNYIPDYGRVPSYFSGPQPPSFNTVDRFPINSILENENITNLYFIWIIFICLLIIILKMKSLYAMSILIPFSLFDIDFRDSFEWKFESSRDKPKISYFLIQTLTKDISDLLNSLEDDRNFSMSLSYISSYKEWQDNKEKIDPLWIDNALIVNKESDPILISQFIMNRLDTKGIFVTNRLFNDHSINSIDAVILTVIVGIKVEI